MDLILAAIAALMGAAGVASAAAAAHASADPRLAVMSQMLMIHGTAVLALVGLGRTAPEAGFAWAALAMTVGACLFAGDLAARHWLGDRLFPMAAPLGGGLTIASWIVAAALAAIAFFRR